MGNEYNDDITWISIACVRASLLFNNKAYLAKAKDQFDKMYARANTTLYGGGLIWKQGTLTKNSCINGPAMVACCYLAQATGDKTYYDKAIYLYTWSKKYLFNASTGKLNDAYDGTVHDCRWNSNVPPPISPVVPGESSSSSSSWTKLGDKSLGFQRPRFLLES